MTVIVAISDENLISVNIDSSIDVVVHSSIYVNINRLLKNSGAFIVGLYFLLTLVRIGEVLKDHCGLLLLQFPLPHLKVETLCRCQ